MRFPCRIAAIAMLALTLGAAMVACNDTSCYENGSSLPLAALYVGDSQQTIGGFTVMGIGAPGDSLILDSATVKEVYLLSCAAGSSTALTGSATATPSHLTISRLSISTPSSAVPCSTSRSTA